MEAHYPPAQRSPRATELSQEVPHRAQTAGGMVELGVVDLGAGAVVEAIAQAALRAGLSVVAWRQRA